MCLHAFCGQSLFRLCPGAQNGQKSMPQAHHSKPGGPGRNPNELMARLVIKYHQEKKNSWRCVAPSCDFVRQGNAQYDHSIKHAITCKALQVHDLDLWAEVIKVSGQSALGAKLAIASAADKEELDTQQALEPTQKKARAQSTLDIGQLRNVGQRGKEESWQLFQAKVDHVVMRIICVRGMVPHLVDSPEWKELMSLLNGLYHPTSAHGFADHHIPCEAVYVREKQIELLWETNNLTLTFDGTSTRKQHSIYTCHATTPTRETYLT